ncbi:hypothetical protein ACX6XY_11635 [Streptomyces sp. O3]
MSETTTEQEAVAELVVELAAEAVSERHVELLAVRRWSGRRCGTGV